jgi:hypothetical protein
MGGGGNQLANVSLMAFGGADVVGGAEVVAVEAGVVDVVWEHPAKNRLTAIITINITKRILVMTRSSLIIPIAVE